jgi:hypothetical protein
LEFKKCPCIFAVPNGKREFSSVGSEHLPYKQRVGGSNPSTPTKASEKSEAFCCHFGLEFEANRRTALNSHNSLREV